jgi:uncharacterized protein YbbC (DUF1343 family)
VPGAYAVQVVNPAAAGGLSQTLAAGFTVVAPVPLVSSSAPNPVTYGLTTSGSTTIFGANFILGATITVGTLSGTTVAGSTATAGTPYVFVSSTQVKFYWPNTSLSPASYIITVRNPVAAGNQLGSLADGFTVIAPQPTVSSTFLNPVTRGVTSSRSITIFGSNFVLGATITVGSLTGTTVAGSTATSSNRYVFTNSGQVKFWWPNTSLPVGSYNVNVTNPVAAGNLGADLADGFVVQ